MSDFNFGDFNTRAVYYSDSSMDLAITSPPYKNSDNYSETLIYETFKNAYRLLKDNTLLFVNFGHLAEDKFRPFRVAQIIMACGFELQETITWIKNHYRPIQGNRRVNNLSEFIFMFSKGKMPLLNRLAVGIPYVDKTNVGRFTDVDNKCSGNVWYIPYETITSVDQKLHNDRFPIALPLNCMDICGYPVDIVLDPFGGSGTTAIACIQRDKQFVSFEIDKARYDVAIERIKREHDKQKV